jgi:hypothetical protein
VAVRDRGWRRDNRRHRGTGGLQTRFGEQEIHALYDGAAYPPSPGILLMDIDNLSLTGFRSP